MVGAVSGSSALSTLTTTTGAGSSAAQIASLESQIQAKQTELEDAKTDEDKAEINEEIAQLQAKLNALEASEARKAQAQQQAAANGQGGQQEPASLVGTRNFKDGEEFGTREIWV